MKLIHSDEMGVLIARLVKASIIHGRCAAFEEIAELKKHFVLEEIPGYRPSLKEDCCRRIRSHFNRSVCLQRLRRDVVPPSVLVKNTVESSKKLKGVELLSDAAQLEIDAQKAINGTKQISVSIWWLKWRRLGLRPEVYDELTGNFADSDEGAGTSLEVPDESKDKSETRDDLDDWGSTDDEEYLLTFRDKKPEDISWQSTDDDES
ncbi:hypothetical protein Tco_0707261 [Tanacetum coccineum]|uniref:Uncharacterized protein n=1 Tax=Tanacetum coccineum TaxID=301880 RepID=A0ABQ4YAK8_9ASTR